MIGPVEVCDGIWRGSRPQTSEDWNKVAGFTVIDLERFPASGWSLWFPLFGILPPLKFRTAIILNELRTPRVMRHIFLHCRDGVDRTGFVVAKFRVLMQGWSKKAAREEMKAMGNHWWLAWWRLFV